MTRWSRRVLLVIAGLCACSAERHDGEADTLRGTAADGSRGALASDDTVLSVEASLRKFREGLKEPRAFSNAAVTREELARRFVAAIVAHDTSTLAELHLTRAEFAWLYYPDNPVSQPPYSLPAGIAWFELQGNSEKGMHRSLRAYGGRRLDYRGLECPNDPVRYGRNTLWNKCIVRVRDEAGADARLQLFATIVERDGAFKIASAANDLGGDRDARPPAATIGRIVTR